MNIQQRFRTEETPGEAKLSFCPRATCHWICLKNNTTSCSLCKNIHNKLNATTANLNGRIKLRKTSLTLADERKVRIIKLTVPTSSPHGWNAQTSSVGSHKSTSIALLGVGITHKQKDILGWGVKDVSIHTKNWIGQKYIRKQKPAVWMEPTKQVMLTWADERNILSSSGGWKPLPT